MKRFVARLAQFLAKEIFPLYRSSLKQVLFQRAVSESADYVSERGDMLMFSGKEIRKYAASVSQKDMETVPALRFLEFGVYKGKSLEYFARLFPHPSRLVGFDSFQGLSESWSFTSMPQGHFQTSPPRMPRNCGLIIGWVDDTLQDFVDRTDLTDVVLVHLDLDLYRPTLFVLRTLRNHLSPGCYVLFDNYLSYPGWQKGEHLALQDSGINYETIAFSSNFGGYDQLLVRVVR